MNYNIESRISSFKRLALLVSSAVLFALVTPFLALDTSEYVGLAAAGVGTFSTSAIAFITAVLCVVLPIWAFPASKPDSAYTNLKKVLFALAGYNVLLSVGSFILAVSIVATAYMYSGFDAKENKAATKECEEAIAAQKTTIKEAGKKLDEAAQKLADTKLMAEHADYKVKELEATVAELRTLDATNKQLLHSNKLEAHNNSEKLLEKHQTDFENIQTNVDTISGEIEALNTKITAMSEEKAKADFTTTSKAIAGATAKLKTKLGTNTLANQRANLKGLIRADTEKHEAAKALLKEMSTKETAARLKYDNATKPAEKAEAKTTYERDMSADAEAKQKSFKEKMAKARGTKQDDSKK
jgi:hypothetical protein